MREPVDAGDVLNLYAAGMKQAHIAKELGVSKQRIWQILKEAKGACRICGMRLINCTCPPRIDKPWSKWKPGGRGRMPKSVKGNFSFSGCYKGK